jgi:hypothetical protein
MEEGGATVPALQKLYSLNRKVRRDAYLRLFRLSASKKSDFSDDFPILQKNFARKNGTCILA